MTEYVEQKMRESVAAEIKSKITASSKLFKSLMDFTGATSNVLDDPKTGILPTFINNYNEDYLGIIEQSKDLLSCDIYYNMTMRMMDCGWCEQPNSHILVSKKRGELGVLFSVLIDGVLFDEDDRVLTMFNDNANKVAYKQPGFAEHNKELRTLLTNIFKLLLLVNEAASVIESKGNYDKLLDEMIDYHSKVDYTAVA